jgi:hypothetical protein
MCQPWPCVKKLRTTQPMDLRLPAIAHKTMYTRISERSFYRLGISVHVSNVLRIRVTVSSHSKAAVPSTSSFPPPYINHIV